MSQTGDNNNNNEEENTHQPPIPNLQVQALMGEMQRLMRVEMETLHERIDRVQEAQRQQQQNRPNQPRFQRQQRRQAAHEEEHDEYYSNDDQSSIGSFRRNRRAGQVRNRNEDNLSGLKLKIPPFHGKNDPDAYLEWEKKIELVFDCQHYSEHKKVRIAATEFCDYAITWWDQLVTSRRRNREQPIETWAEMKAIMRKRFVPNHYHRELFQKLRRLSQGNQSVEDYFQEMESLMIKADIDEDREATMSIFLGGLNREIQDRLEMQHYVEMEEMLHKAILVEQQLKRRGNTRQPFVSSSKTGYQKEDRQKQRVDVQPRVETKPKPTGFDLKGKAESSNTRNRDVQCFKCHGRGHYANECPNKRTMILLENGDIETEEEVVSDSMPSLEDCEEDASKGDLLVARRVLNVKTKAEDNEQRENLFYSRCRVKDKVCSLIIDGGSCTNVASTVMVEKLDLKPRKHPKPYHLHWLNDNGNMKVTKQVMVPLSIGKYEDEVLCDVLPMEAGHILLGRPWQFDRKVSHDGFTNKHSFEYKGKRIILNCMSPQKKLSRSDFAEAKERGKKFE